MTSTAQFNNCLAPEYRLLLSQQLRPPVGYSFDSGIATTYSLDIETALEIPIHLALFAKYQKGGGRIHDLPLLESISSMADNLLIFANIGEIKTRDKPASKLWTLLEDNIFEVSAKNGGVFHPKIWILKYHPENSKSPKLIRLLILSRNITKDRSWDTIMSLDGEIKKQNQVGNDSILKLLGNLPELAKRDSLGKNKLKLISGLSNDVRKTNWELPEDFEGIKFAVNGIDNEKWLPQKCDRLGVISPFCTDGALRYLAGLSKDRMLISRHEELVEKKPKVLDKFECSIMNENLLSGVEGEEGVESLRGRKGTKGEKGVKSAKDNEIIQKEDDDISSINTGLHGLHAKIYVAESKNETRITIGSGNATDAGLMNGSNVEFFATLTGNRSKVGGVEEILGEEGFGRLTTEFEPLESDDESAEMEKAIEKRLDIAWKKLCDLEMKLECGQLKKVVRKASGNDNEKVSGKTDEKAVGKYEETEYCDVKLVIPQKCPLPAVSNIQVRLVTLETTQAEEALQNFTSGKNIVFEKVQSVDLTRFVAFELCDRESGESKTYCTGLKISGLPDSRVSKIYNHYIKDKDSFYQFLRLMLSDPNDPALQYWDSNENRSSIKARRAGADIPLLEELLVSFCRDQAGIQKIDKFISRFESGNSKFRKDVLEDFLKQWNVIKTAILNKKGGSK